MSPINCAKNVGRQRERAAPGLECGRKSVLAGVCGALMTGAAIARSPFDGSWSVVFYSGNGACGSGYRAGVVIQNGVIYPEASGITFNGRISSKGVVRASVSSGGQSAVGSGRLARSSGGGVWQGGSCSGTWARRPEKSEVQGPACGGATQHI